MTMPTDDNARLREENERLTKMVQFAGALVAHLSDDAPRCELGARLYREWAEHEAECDDCAALAPQEDQ